MKKLFVFISVILIIITFYGGELFLPRTLADEVDVLKGQIDDRNKRLAEIEKEIAEYKNELKKVGGEKNTLQKAINQLELERKKVQADVSYTQNQIGATDLELSKLRIEINEAERRKNLNENAIAEMIRRLSEMDDESVIVSLLTYKNLSEFWSQFDELSQVRDKMKENVHALLFQKETLQSKESENIDKRSELVVLKNKYSDQNNILVSNKAEKNKLLQSTKNEESEYQKLIKQKEAAQAALLKEIRDFESKLKFALDPTTIPTQGTAVFNWPVENFVITQLFGGTEFAKANSSVYAGRAYHPGIDLGVPVGTPIKAPLAGVVRATGNTDAVAGCYSWGKWTLIDHANGLSTLYAHQSTISVTPGQSVATGDIIGYSGNTGYSTGPHLHFTVYAKAGVSVRYFREIKAVTSCGAAQTPVAATDAYIDPMLYLPAR